ncbi:hypothetical protein [Coraliomargarita akajimensis]|nr:hypothetical protein [Coraliomargarita akajimensis]
MIDILLEILQHPFVLGLIVGLIMACVLWLRYVRKQREQQKSYEGQVIDLRASISRLEAHIKTQMELTAGGNAAQKEEIEELKKRCENLQLMNHNLTTKASRAELRQLHLYETALSVMHVRAPGFSVAWSEAVKDAEVQLEQESKGFLKWIRKPFQSGHSKSSAPQLTDSDQ